MRESATESGIQAVGVAPPIDEARDIYGWAGSVVVAAISYLPADHDVQDDRPRGRVARFARSTDYHLVLRDKLSGLAGFLKSQGARTQVCVDTCPLPERKLAVLGGIASRGKSGNVFVEGCGSYAALGEIVTDLKLPAPTPIETDPCGECDRCIRACPSGAIIAPFTVDADRCLSNLTQTGGIIPREFREAMGNRIYGCDVCQEVCPHNDDLKPISLEFAQAVFPGASPELVPLIKLTAPDYRARVKGSSIGWIRRTRIRRNAAIAAGNRRAKTAVPALVEMLRDEDPVLRGAAAWALGKIGSDAARRALESAANKERDKGVAEEIRAALSRG